MPAKLTDLLAARNDAIAERAAATSAMDPLESAARAAGQALANGRTRKEQAERGVADADAAIHGLLKDRGMHSLVDPKDQTVVIYTASEKAPGWFATHPIPGTGA